VPAVRVFISYRQDTDGARAALVEKSIQGGFGSPDSPTNVSVFRDVRLRLGVPWPEALAEELRRADVVVVVIGPGWSTAVDQKGRRRLNQEDDWVRREIEIALALDRTIIPLLFDDADMPSADLPDSITRLGDIQGLKVRTSSFDNDVQPLLNEIVLHGDGPPEEPNVRSPDRGTRWPYPNPPLPITPAAFSDAEIDIALQQMIPEWSKAESPLDEDPQRTRVELSRELEFRSFPDVLRFMSEVGKFCEELNHHPRWENIYKTLRIHLSTWDIGHRISHVDVILAAHIDKEFARYQAGLPS
jgi:pterin-4a-carbinolamine dehydratase